MSHDAVTNIEEAVSHLHWVAKWLDRYEYKSEQELADVQVMHSDALTAIRIMGRLHRDVQKLPQVAETL